MKITNLNDGTYKIEFRVWSPLTASSEERPPTISVFEARGYPYHLRSDLRRRIRDWAQEGEIGPLMSIADIFATMLPDILEGTNVTEVGGE